MRQSALQDGGMSLEADTNALRHRRQAAQMCGKQPKCVAGGTGHEGEREAFGLVRIDPVDMKGDDKSRCN